MENINSLEVEAKKMFDSLRKHINEQVIVSRYLYGKLVTEEMKIMEVEDFKYLHCEEDSIPFLGYSSNCLLCVNTFDGELLYVQPKLMGYHCKNDEDILKYTRMIFGERIAQEEQRLIDQRNNQHKEYFENKFRYFMADLEEEKEQKEGRLETLADLASTYVSKDKQLKCKEFCLRLGSIKLVEFIMTILAAMSDGVDYTVIIEGINNLNALTSNEKRLCLAIIGEFNPEAKKLYVSWLTTLGNEEPSNKMSF